MELIFLLGCFVLESSLCSWWTPINGSYVFNSVSSLSIMESSHVSTDSFLRIVNRNKKLNSSENCNYLYPSYHRMTHQIKWFKSSLDQYFSPNISA